MTTQDTQTNDADAKCKHKDCKHYFELTNQDGLGFCEIIECCVIADDDACQNFVANKDS